MMGVNNKKMGGFAAAIAVVFSGIVHAGSLSLVDQADHYYMQGDFKRGDALLASARKIHHIEKQRPHPALKRG